MSTSTTTERLSAAIPAVVALADAPRPLRSRRKGRHRGGPVGFLAVAALVLALWMLVAGIVTAVRPGEAMVIALGRPASLMMAGHADSLRLVRVVGPFVVAAVSGREGVGALYAAGALIVLPGRRGGCGLAG